MVWVESRHIEQKEEVRHMPEKALFQSVLSGSAQRTMCRLAARVGRRYRIVTRHRPYTHSRPEG